MSSVSIAGSSTPKPIRSLSRAGPVRLMDTRPMVLLVMVLLGMVLLVMAPLVMVLLVTARQAMAPLDMDPPGTALLEMATETTKIKPVVS